MLAIAEPLHRPVSGKSYYDALKNDRAWTGWIDEAADVGDGEVERYARTTRRAAFLAEMERIVPRPVLCALIHPSDPKRNAR
jgi:hypothetical protein